jgi:hypothetical protein
MIIFSLSEVSLSKALGAAPPSTGVSIPGGGGGGRVKGPAGKEKEGHKYISREWEGDHWEYEYTSDPHPERHGLEHSVSDDKQGHSLDLPEHLVGSVAPYQAPDTTGMDEVAAFSAEKEARQAHQKEMEALFFNARKQSVVPGMKWTAPDPRQGQEGKVLHFEVVGNRPTTRTIKDKKTGEERVVPSQTPHGYGIVIRKPPEEGKERGKVLSGKEGGKGDKKGVGSLAALEKWNILASRTRDVPDPETGEVAFSITPNLGKIDFEQDRLLPPAAKKLKSGKEKAYENYFIKFPAGSHENYSDLMQPGEKSGYKDRLGKATWEDAEHHAEKLLQARQTERGKMPSMGALLEEKGALGTLLSSFFPRNRAAERTRNNTRNTYAAWDSPEQRHQAFSAVASPMKERVDKLAERLFDPETEDPRLKGLGLWKMRGELEPLMHVSAEGKLGAAVGSALDSIWTRGNYKEHKGRDGDKPAPFAPYYAETLGRHLADIAEKEGLIGAKEAAAIRGVSKDEAAVSAEDKQAAERFASDRAAGESGPDVQLSGEEGAISFNEEQATKLNERIGDWKKEQADRLRDWGQLDPSHEQALSQIANNLGHIEDASDVQTFVNKIKDMSQSWYAEEPGSVGEFNDEVISFVHDMVKSLTAVFVEHIAMKALQHDLRMQIRKAKITEPDPAHTYVRKEGMDDNPSFLYQDPQGNYVRYTNAPEGSADYSPFGGAPRVHTSEPSMDMAPEYFTPDGRKLTRAPHPAAQIQWNPNYHSNDPQNLWAGRWVNPATGEHEYTYIDADMRDSKKLRLHQMNRLVDIRIPHLRRYTSGLLHSDQPKDNVVGLMLAMVDQGRVHPVELAKLKSGDIQMHGDIIRFGRFAVHAGEKIQQIVHRMMNVRQPEDSFFSVPVMKNEPDSVIGVDTDYRTIGPHYIARILARLGTPLEGLLSYHATQTYSMQLQRCIQGTNVSLKCGHEFALLEVARRMGHDFENEPDVNPVLKQILETMIDPVVVEVMEQNARNSGDDQGSDDMTRQVVLAVPHISANLQGHTNSEKEFSGWLHNHPFHEHAEVRRTYEAA